MLQDQRVGVIQLIHGNVNSEVFLGQSHVLIHLDKTLADADDVRHARKYFKSVIEIPNFTEVIEELVDARFIIFDKGVERDHVDLLRIRGLVCKVLQHLRNLVR